MINSDILNIAEKQLKKILGQEHKRLLEIYETQGIDALLNELRGN